MCIRDSILAAAESQDVVIEKVLVTHGHLDHAGAVADLAEELGVPVEGPQREDAFWIDRIAEQGTRYGMTHCRRFTPDRWLEDGDRVTIGTQTLDVYHCPGHTPGHVVFHHKASRLALVGDVLFRGSIGRSDLPRGNHAELIRSIVTKLWPLGSEMCIRDRSKRRRRARDRGHKDRPAGQDRWACRRGGR